MPLPRITTGKPLTRVQKGAGRHDHWRTHMQGLKHLVEIAGGLESFQFEPMVLNKIYR